ncbi:MAG: flippase [Candidatus Paceibacterota bacterium]|jgi:O-antigen/teichoic acid export membrane protein
MIARLKQLLFQNKNTRQTVIKNVFWLSFSQIISRGIRALIIIYSARLLGTAEYGIFSYALSLAGFFTLFADIGLSSILTREVSQKPERASEYFSTAFWIKVILLIGTAFAVIFISPYFSKLEGAKALLPLVAFLVIFDNIREFCNAFFRGKERMEREALITLLTNIAIAFFGFLALSSYRTSTAITVSYISSAGLGMLAAIFMLRNEFVHIISNFRKELVSPIFSAAWSIAALGLLGVFMLNIDVIMLGWLRTASDVGLYSAGQRIVQVLYVLPSILAASTFPALSRAIGKNESSQVKNIMERSMAIIFFVALPLAVGGIVLGVPIVAFVFGSEYLPGALTFQILMATLLFVFPGTLIGNYILGYNRQRDVAKFVAFASIGNAVFNYIFITPFGIAGAALATIVVQSFYNFFMWRFAKKIHNFQTLYHLKKIGVATLIMGIAAFLMNLVGFHILVTIALSGLLYIGVLVILKEKITHEILLIVRGI